MLSLRGFDRCIARHSFRGINVHLGGDSLSNKFVILLHYSVTYNFRPAYETIGFLSSPRFAGEINNNDIIHLFLVRILSMLLVYYLYQQSGQCQAQTSYHIKTTFI